MKTFRVLLLIFTISTPYLILAMFIPLAFDTTDVFFWICLVLLFIGILSFFVDLMLSAERKKK